MNKNIFILLFLATKQSQTFIEGRDNPYQTNLTDAEKARLQQEEDDLKLAIKLQQEEDDELNQEKNRTNILNKLNIINNRYYKNYFNYLLNNSSVKNILHHRSEESNFDNQITYLTAACITLANQKNTMNNSYQETCLIREEIKKIKKIIKQKKDWILKRHIYGKIRLSLHEIEIINTSATLLALKEEINNTINNKKIDKINPGIIDAFKTISDNKLIKDGEEIKEVKYLLYFLLKENYEVIKALFHKI